MNERKKTLGVIGGMGPLATAYLAQMLALHSDVKTDQEHIDLLIHSHPETPDRTAYILGKSTDSPLPHLIKTGRTLCDLGVDLLAIPCVTSHFFYRELSDAFPVPVVNMLEETAGEVLRQNADIVGVMATTGTVSTHLFQNTFAKYGIQTVIPDDDRQNDVMYLIYNCVKAGEPIDWIRFQRVTDQLFARGAQKIILGCTELSAVNMGEKSVDHTICALNVLAKSSLTKLGVKIKQRG